MKDWEIIEGNCIDVLPTLLTGSVNCCVTSPPYWGLRDYGHGDQLGLETTPEEYVEKIVSVFREIRRVLRPDGTLWLNLGDSYIGAAGGRQGKNSQMADRSVSKARANRILDKKCEGLKPKDLAGIPWRVAFALQADGWWLRSDVIWAKSNPMPESVTDRPTKSHEYLFLLSKSARYFYDAEAIAEQTTDPEYREKGKIRPTATGGKGFEIRGGLHKQEGGRLIRNRRTVWTIPTQPFPGAHFAVMPPALVEPCILAGCPIGGTVLDPFGGAATVGVVARRLQRRTILIEINPEYAEMGRRRIEGDAPLFNRTMP